MTFRCLEDIRVWGMAQDLAVKVYRVEATEGRSLDFGYRDQIRRAAVSIFNNIAEGFGRGGDPEFLRFLDIARGSANEVLSLVHLGRRLGYIPHATTEEFLQDIAHLLTRIANLQHYLRSPRVGEPAEEYRP